jgi:hypothetical protein
MDSRTSSFEVYNQLADWYEQKGPASMRDRFLVLAADAALEAGEVDVAEYLRTRLLQVNPHHLLKPYASFVQALAAAEVQTYVGDLRRNYPPEAARQLLHSLRDGPGQTAQGLPPTAPLIHFEDDEDDELTHLEPAPELLKVYPLAQDAEQTAIVPPPQPARPTRAPAPPPQSAAATKSASAAPTVPAPRSAKATPRQPTPMPPTAPAPRRPTVSPPPSLEPEEPSRNGWLGTVLFVVVCLAGLALAGYSLLRPFLPSSWLP